MNRHLIDVLVEQTQHHPAKEIFRYRESPEGPYVSQNRTALFETVTHISRSLHALGYRKGEKIGIFGPNSHYWLQTDLAIMALGAATVPIYATASDDQLNYILSHTDMRILFVGAEQVLQAEKIFANNPGLQQMVIMGKVESLPEKVMSWEAFLSLETSPDFDFLSMLDDFQGTDMATLIYTSGTTGEPKGVMLSHDNFMHCFHIHDLRLEVSPEDVSLCFLPLSHIFERLWCHYLLYRGAIIAFLENPKEVIQVLPVVKPNLMCTVPRFFEKTYQGIVDEVAKWPAAKRKIFSWAVSVGHQVSDYRAKGATPPGLLGLKHRLADKLVLSKLRKIFGGQIKVMPCAGAAIPVDILKFFHAVGIFVNFGYGLTETMATVSCLRSDTYDLESCGSIMPEVEVMIGAGGEILVRGKSVFQGYYKDPDYTASVMREGWFHTGDEGFLTPNGDLVMTDRIKDLMKTSVGKYVSPQKLEMLLAQDKHVDQIIVVGDNRKFVTALVVPVMDKLKSFAQIHGIDWQDEEALCQQQQVLEMLKLRFDQLQAGLSPYERVVHFALLPKAFSIEAGTMTSTLKLRRRAIEKRFAPLIEQMYSKA